MIKAKTILSLFLFITLHQLEAQNFSVCLHFSPKPNSAICSISLNTKVSKTFQAKDTCINLNISGRSQHSLEVSALGYKTESITFNLDTLRKPIVITLQEKNILLQEVEVKASPLITMKGDTLVINAKNIFTKPQSDATELINNLPGGMITPNGQIYLFGKPISNITIEGMSIFGGNPKTILMLLKADMVAFLEILPNGDNQRNEVNIRLKEGRKKGIYGEVEVLAGSFDRESEGIKINRISPNKFLSFFSTANNLNQKNATIGNSISLASSFFKRIDGAYSLTEFIDGYATEASKFKYLPTSINDDGINTNKTTGINYSFKVKNQDWIAFSVLDANKRSYQELNKKSLYFSDKELFKNISDNRNYKTYEWLNTVGLNWKVDAKNTLKWLQSYRWTNATINSKYNSTSSVASIDVNDLNIFDNQSYRTQHNFIANQQLQFIHRHQKPGRVSSLYLAGYWEQKKDDFQYANTLKQSSSLLDSNNQLRNQPFNNLFIDFQFQHSLPLSRTWLLDTKIFNKIDQKFYKQSVYNWNSINNTYDDFLGFSSIPTFEVLSSELGVQAVLLYKKRHWQLASGLGLTYLRFSKKFPETIIEDNRMVFIPKIYAEYNILPKGKVSVLYQRKYQYPDAQQLFPIPDSSNITSIQLGNPSLSIMEKHSFKLSVNFPSASGKLLSLNLNYEFTRNNIIGGQALTGVITNNYYLQKNLASSYWQVMASYSLFNQRNWSLYTINSLANINNYTVLDNNTLPIRMYYYYTNLSLKWNPIRTTSLKLDWKGNLFGNDLGNNIKWNFRNEFAIRTESQLTEKLFINSNLTVFQNFFQKNIRTIPILDLTVSGYLWHNKVKLNGSLMNVFNQNPTYSHSASGNETTEQSKNFLRRYFSLGATLYLSKWGK